MIRRCFYTMITKSILSLYMHPDTMLAHSDVRISDVKPGDMVRCIIRIQGVSQIMGKDGMRLRLHHYVPSIWHH